MTATRRAQNRLPASYYRGGTSRAVFFQTQHLPENKSKWPLIFLGVIGSPDPNGRQLDGMGGGISSLSKICVVGPSTHPEADVDYTFAAIGVKDTEVDFSSNCGNMTSAVGPFAVDAKIVPLGNEVTGDKQVRIHNTNTGKIIHSTFPVEEGEAVAHGDFKIDGVAGDAARVQLDFLNPAGSRTGKLLPTGNKVDEIDGVPVTCIDVGNPCCFVQAASLDVDGGLTPDDIEQHPSLLKRLDSVRRQAGVRMGLAKSLEEVPGSVPKICLVSPTVDSALVDFRVRAISVGQPHKAVPITVALSAAAASKLEGSVVYSCVKSRPIHSAGVTLGHASGKLMVGAKFEDDGGLKFATVFRTARRLMDGTIFWK